MDNRNINRLGLRGEALHTATARAAQDVKMSAKTLQFSKNEKVNAEKSWKDELQKALERGNTDSVSEQKLFLSNSLNKLKKLSAEVSRHRLQEKQNLRTLAKNIKDYQIKNRQLQECKSRKSLIESVNQALRDQSETDESAALRYVGLSKSLNSKFNPDNNSEISDRSVESVTTLPEISSSFELKNLPAVFIHEKPAVIGNERKINSDLRDSRLAQYQLAEDCNRPLKVNCVQSSSGTFLSVDYLLKPGHLFSVQAYKANQPKVVQVEIESSTPKDRKVLLNNIENFEKHSKAKVKII